MHLWCYTLSAISRRLATAVAHLLYFIRLFLGKRREERKREKGGGMGGSIWSRKHPLNFLTNQLVPISFSLVKYLQIIFVKYLLIISIKYLQIIFVKYLQIIFVKYLQIIFVKYLRAIFVCFFLYFQAGTDGRRYLRRRWQIVHAAAVSGTWTHYCDNRVGTGVYYCSSRVGTECNTHCNVQRHNT